MNAILNAAAKVILPIFIIIGGAAWVGKRFNPDPRALASLHIYLLSPALVVTSLSKTALSVDEIGQSVALAVIMYALMALVGWSLARAFRFNRQLTSSFMLCTILLNAGNYGLALTEFAFGAEGRQPAIIFYVMSAVAANTIGVYLASSGQASTKEALLTMLKVPLPYALALGLTINAGVVTLPSPVLAAIDTLADAAVPTMLALLGVKMAHISINRQRLFPIALAAGARLAIAPLLAIPLSVLLGMVDITQQVAIIQSSMPTAVISVSLSTEFGGDSEFASAVIVVSTLASVVTLSVLLTILA